MNFEGKTCGECGKGRLHSTQDEIAEGVYVDAFKCSHCGGISYAQGVMAKVEAMQRAVSEERRLVKVGSSVAAIIPAAIVDALGLKPKEKVLINARGNRIIIVPSPS